MVTPTITSQLSERVVGAVVGQADGEVRITVQPGQFATLLRGNNAETFA
jgi:hypothetical protein